MNAALAELFPDGDYRFHLTLRRGEPREFFAPRDSTGRVLAERARWLDEAPARYAALQPEGAASLAEFEQMAAGWRSGSPGAFAASRIHALGASLEPDILLLSPDDQGDFRLRGGALCFPTGWALEEKLGHTLEFIHGVVPGLNRALAAPLQQFLSKLKPGVALLRDNWGIAATDELNLHPARRMAPPTAPVALDRLWLRVEHQALVALPESRGIIFGIRIALHRLDEPEVDSSRAGLRRALETMPSELIGYKRLDAIRDDLIKLL